MLDLAEIPFFATLSAESIARLRSAIQVQHYAQGTIIAGAGKPGRYFQAIAAGVVRVQPETTGMGNARGMMLGPGQIIGEMSLFTGMPISATLTAARETYTYCLDGAMFLRLLDEEPELLRGLTRSLIERLRHRTRYAGVKPELVVITSQDRDFDLEHFATVLAKGVTYYEPGSSISKVALAGDSASAGKAADALDRWREGAAAERYLLAPIKTDFLRAFSHYLRPEDTVLEVIELEKCPIDEGASHAMAGAADYSRVYLGKKPQRSPSRWGFGLPVSEFMHAATSYETWDPHSLPNLDHIARHITYREVGIALSSGGAHGFAHVGVLEVLEEHGIPIDYLCGTSMGGVVALSIAHSASVHEGTHRIRNFLGGNRKIRDTAWWPRASVFSGGKVADAARQMFGDATFADLRLPAAVVVSDLALGDRAIIDAGVVAPAALGTSAIPGFFPPIAFGTMLMVDGAIVSRVPVDVLDRRRCGLRIAVNVVSPGSDDEGARRHRQARLRSHSARFLGWMNVLGASWELLGSYGSNLEALRADIVISPETHRRGRPFDFDRYEELIECGRAAALSRIDAIRETVRTTMRSANR